MLVSSSSIVAGVLPPEESPVAQEEAHDAESWHSKFTEIHAEVLSGCLGSCLFVLDVIVYCQDTTSYASQERLPQRDKGRDYY
ncbi:hypothetical protein J6590_057571 [Homalodisca vitripennis]|nr:hypothetical protein J6590_057571 [Homalodisca vitripennis]